MIRRQINVFQLIRLRKEFISRRIIPHTDELSVSGGNTSPVAWLIKAGLSLSRISINFQFSIKAYECRLLQIIVALHLTLINLANVLTLQYATTL